MPNEPPAEYDMSTLHVQEAHGVEVLHVPAIFRAYRDPVWEPGCLVVIPAVGSDGVQITGFAVMIMQGGNWVRIQPAIQIRHGPAWVLKILQLWGADPARGGIKGFAIPQRGELMCFGVRRLPHASEVEYLITPRLPDISQGGSLFALRSDVPSYNGIIDFLWKHSELASRGQLQHTPIRGTDG